MLGFNAFGRYALGQISDLLSITLTGVGASSTGVAGIIGPNPAAQLIGVAGTGQAGTITANPQGILSGVQGIGVAGSISGSISGFLQGAVGIGLAGQIIGQVAPATLTGVSCTGTAGKITIVISGGGGIKRRGGLEPIRKPRKLPPESPLAPLPIPRDRPPRPLPPQQAPAEIVDRTLIPESLLDLQDQILSAHDSQDVQDIADILELID